MHAAQHNPVNSALAALLTLNKAKQSGQFQPTTPQGTPTVAAQDAQQAMQSMMPQGGPQGAPQGMAGPGIQQAAEQAGIAGQIQAQQMQQAQQAMMQQAMAQQQGQMPPQMPPMPEQSGIAKAAPNMGGFADGGIVGYAEAGTAKDDRSQFLRDIMSIPDWYQRKFDEAREEDRRRAEEAAGSQAKRDLITEAQSKGSFFNYLFGTPEREKQGREDLSRLLVNNEAARLAKRYPASAAGAAPASTTPEAPASTAGLQVQANDPRAMLAQLMGATNIPEAERGEAIRNLMQQYPDLLKQQAPQGAAPAAPAAPAAQTIPGGGITTALPTGAESPYKLAKSSEAAINEMMETSRKQAKPPTYEEMFGDAVKRNEILRQLAVMTGNNPDLIKEQIAQIEELYGKREKMAQERERELREKAPSERLTEFLLGARGRSFADTMRGGAQSSRAYDAHVQSQIQQLQDLQMELQGLKLEKTQLLKKLKYETEVTGNFAKAEDLRKELYKNEQESLKAEREAAAKKAELQSLEARSGETAFENRLSRIEGIRQREQQANIAAEGKEQQLLQRYYDELRKVEADIDRKFKDDQRVKMYNMLSLTAKPDKPIPPEVVAGYKQAIKDHKEELERRAGGVMGEIDRLEAKLYPGKVKVKPSASSDLEAADKIVGGGR